MSFSLNERTDQVSFAVNKFQGSIPMKLYAIITGFLLLTTAVALPCLLKRKGSLGGRGTDENIRYDIDDLMVAEGL